MEILQDFLLNNVVTQEILKNPTWQISWIIAMFLSILWYTQKDDKKVIKVFMVSNVAWIIHFYFMWTFSAMIACVIAIARLLLSLKYKRNKKFFFGILAAILVSWVATYENHLSALPIIASMVSAYGFFFFERIKLRLFMLISSTCWLIFSFWEFSIWWMVSDSVVLIVLIYTLIKMIIEENGKSYFKDKIMAILRSPNPDLWRYVVFSDILRRRKVLLKDKIKYYYKKADSIKIYFFKDKKFLKIEKEEFSI